jgi:hypothetical protein
MNVIIQNNQTQSLYAQNGVPLLTILDRDLAILRTEIDNLINDCTPGSITADEHKILAQDIINVCNDLQTMEDSGDPIAQSPYFQSLKAALEDPIDGMTSLLSGAQSSNPSDLDMTLITMNAEQSTQTLILYPIGEFLIHFPPPPGTFLVI